MILKSEDVILVLITINKIYCLRDILAHTYFQVEDQIIWDVVQSKIKSLEQEVRQILNQEFK
jgi:uncharacterized protein with HEPN domain